jgi:PAS domain S-box-containing protein
VIGTRALLRPLALGLAAGLAAFLAGELGWLSGLDDRSYDLAVRTRPPRRGASDIAVVQIDDEAMRSLGRWPWPWQRHADFIDTLRASYHPAAIVFDILFSEPESPQASARLAEAMRGAGNVYLAAYLTEAGPRQEETEAPPVNWRAAEYRGGSFWHGKRYVALRPPVEALARAARGVGPVNAVPELDGSIRRLPVVIDYRGVPYLTLTALVAQERVSSKPGPLRVWLGHEAELGALRIPIDAAGEMLVSYAGTSPYDRFRYSEVLAGRVPVEALRGKVVLVGFGAVGMADIHPTPVASGMLGVDINAQAMDGLMRRSFLRSGSPAARLGVVLAMALLVAVVVALLPPARAVVMALLLVIGGLGLSRLALWYGGVWLGAGAPLLAAAGSYGLTAVHRHRVSERETMRMQVAVSTLSSAARLIGSVRRRPELLAELLSQVRDTTGADQTDIYLTNPERQGLELVASDGEEGAAEFVPLGEGAVGWAAQHRATHMERRPRLADPEAGPAGCAIYAPMQWRDQNLGVIRVVRSPDRPPFAEEDLPIISALASEAAVALENMHLYEQLEGKIDLADRELVQAYAGLKQERDRVSAIVSNMADGVLLMDAERRLVYLNPAAEAMLGVSAEVLGRPVSEVLPYPALLAQLDREAPAEEVPVPRIVIEQPRRSVLSPRTVLLSDVQDRPTGALTVLSDITLLEELSEMKSEFVSLVSHELRTPLTSIMGFSQILRGDSGRISMDDQKEFLGIIEQESNRLLVMINDLLDVSRMEAGRPLSMNPVPLDLGRLAQEVVRFQQVTTTAHTFAFAFPDGPLTVEADRDRVQQILTNLISNAIKYSPNGGEVCIGGREDSDGALMWVSDEGMGMTEEQVSMLFQRFQRVDRDAIKGIRGTGLGLFLVRGLVEAHGGRIWAESVPGEGSTFFVRLPLVAAIGSEAR